MDLARRRAIAADRPSLSALAGGILPALAYLAALVPALGLAFGQPVWSRVDEAQHYDFVAQLANGTYPISDRTTLRPETVRIMDRTGIYRWFQPNGDAQPSDTDPRDFRMPPAGISRAALSQWLWRHVWWFSYESVQPPLYYLAMTPFWLAAGRLGGPLAAVYLLRGVNALAVAGLASVAYLVAREVLPGHPGFSLAAAVVTALIPGLVLNSTQVTNDTLAALLGATVLFWSVRGAVRAFTPREAALTGALLGAATLTKLTAAGLAAAVLTAALAPVLRDPRRLPDSVLASVLAGACALAVFAPWVALNERIYRHPLPAHEFMSEIFQAPALSRSTIETDVQHGFVTFWTGEPVGTLPLVDQVTNFALIWVLLACLGLALVGIRRRFAPGGLLVLGAAIAGEALLALALPVVSHVGGLTPGRYLYPAVVAVTTALVAGTWSLVPIPPLRAAIVLAFAGTSAAALTGFLHGGGPAQQPLHEHYVPPPGQGRAVSATGYFADVHVKVDRFLDDSAHGNVWIHVVVDNTARSDTDWWPRPHIELDHRVSTRTDYGASQPLPETLRGHGHYEGWLVAPTNGQPGPFHHVTVTFEAIAAYGYHTMGNLVVQFDAAP